MLQHVSLDGKISGIARLPRPTTLTTTFSLETALSSPTFLLGAPTTRLHAYDGDAESDNAPNVLGADPSVPW